MNRLSENEKLMYEVMGAIANSNVPIVYKGAMITKLILQENNFEEFERETLDVDASWAGGASPSMEQLTEMLNRALAKLRLSVIVKREHGEKMSAGFKVVDIDGIVKLSIDIDMRSAIDIRTYHYGKVTFQGVTPDNVLADKISAVSSNMVFRRSKDLVDLYALAHCVKVRTESIRNIWNRENRLIGNFDAFVNRQDDLRHSYNKLRRVSSK